jgi:hypothetical protein
MSTELLPFLGLVFAAGGFYFVVRGALNQLNLSINRVGEKLHEANKRSQNNHYRMTIILLVICPEKDREQLASWLLQGVIGQ